MLEALAPDRRDLPGAPDASALVEALVIDIVLADVALRPVTPAILHGVGTTDGEGADPVAALARETVQRLGRVSDVVIYLHPEDVKLLEKRLGGEALLTGVSSVQITADCGMSRGDCRVESGEVVVVQELETELARLREHLLLDDLCAH